MAIVWQWWGLTLSFFDFCTKQNPSHFHHICLWCFWVPAWLQVCCCPHVLFWVIENLYHFQLEYYGAFLLAHFFLIRMIICASIIVIGYNFCFVKTDAKHPGCDSSYLGRREFSFTLEHDIYIRYLSFHGATEMESSIREKCPYKIDIGAVYNVDVSKNWFSSF